jgi:hypothetical protein
MIDKNIVQKAFENIRRESQRLQKRNNNDEEYEKTVKLLDLRVRIKKFNYCMLNLVVFISLRQGKLGDFLVAVICI